MIIVVFFSMIIAGLVLEHIWELKKEIILFIQEKQVFDSFKILKNHE